MSTEQYYAIIRKKLGYRFVGRPSTTMELWSTPDGEIVPLPPADQFDFEARGKYVRFVFGTDTDTED